MEERGRAKGKAFMPVEQHVKVKGGAETYRDLALRRL